MLFNTHIQMGIQLHAWMNPEQSKTLPREAFIYGHVKPDIVRKGHGRRHTFRDSRDYMAGLCGRLLERPDERGRGIVEDAVNIGSICHYISDAFCRFHYDEALYARLGNHFAYEVGLNRRFFHLLHTGRLPGRKGNDQEAGWADCHISHPELSSWSVVSSLFRHLEAQIAEYGEKEPSFDLDILYSMNNSTHALEKLLPALARLNLQSALIPAPEEYGYALMAGQDEIWWRNAI